MAMNSKLDKWIVVSSPNEYSVAMEMKDLQKLTSKRVDC